ncbi:hypothetical protein ACFU6E_09910 [Bacillus cereus]|uniref:hypothetical protein n=1 Tax=Bacillus cereus TaxID=1396 RepID=UPI00366C56C2
MGRKSKRRKRKKQREVIRSKHELVVTKKRSRSKIESGLIDAANVMYFIVMGTIFINLIKLQVSNLSLHVFVLIIFLMVAILVHVLVFGTLLSTNKNGGEKGQRKEIRLIIQAHQVDSVTTVAVIVVAQVMVEEIAEVVEIKLIFQKND